MADGSFMPAEPYLYCGQAPVGGMRPISQGDVFQDIPILRAPTASPRHEGQFVSQIKTGPKSLGMLVTHPCASRSRSTHRLKESLSIAPVIRAPKDMAPPWESHYEFFPLPQLDGADDYAADLSAVFPVRTEFLVGKRIACLTKDSLAGLFHRLTVNATRLADRPEAFAAEAERLTFETDLWEKWANSEGTEDGFQEWLDEPFSPPEADGDAETVAASEPSTRRSSLRWFFEEIEADLDAEPSRRRG